MQHEKFNPREDKRIRIDLDILIKSLKDSNSVLTKCKVLDMSRTGLLIETTIKFKINEEVELDFLLVNQPLNIKAKVKRVNQKNENTYLIGINLEKLDKYSEKIISDFFESINYYGWFY